MAGRSIKAGTRRFGNLVRYVKGNGVSVNDVWEGTKQILKRTSQPIVSSILSVYRDFFHDEPEEIAALDADDETDINTENLEWVVETLRTRAAAQYPGRAEQIDRLTAGLGEGIAQCSELRTRLEEETYAEQIDDRDVDGLIAEFHSDVEKKIRNRKELQAMARLEVAQADREIAAEADQERRLQLTVESNPISAEAAEIINNASQEGGIVDLPMSGVNVSDRGALRANAEESINYHRRFLQQSLQDSWAEYEWLIAQGYAENSNNNAWLENQGYGENANNRAWRENQGYKSNNSM
jgi:hypothetical protein